MAEARINAGAEVIAMRDVSVSSRFDAAQAVATGVNWTVRTGEFWAVAGAQRSGKTDLLMLAGGLTAPKGGDYFFLGERMPIFEEDRLPHRLKVSFVFENGQLFNHMTVAENVALPLRYHEDLSRTAAEPRVRELLELMELVPFGHQHPQAVARNWQKRAGLARALMLKPELLLVDNVLAGLDARHAAWWLNFLEQLRAGHSFMGGRPLTVVVVADDLPRLASSLGADARFAVLHDRRFEAAGDRNALFASREPWVRELLNHEESVPTE